MLINLRNALMSGKRLPYDAEVEYIRGTGTQYINSGLTVSNALRVKCRVSIDGVCWIFGGRTGGNNKQFSVYQQASTNIRWGYANASVNKTNSYGVHDIDFNQNAVYFDGALLHTFAASTFSSPSPLYVGTLSIDERGTPASQCLIGNIYAFQVYMDGVLVRDYIPVRKGTVGYIYDRVSGKLFGNAGTGDFVVGPDVVPVEYIEGTGTQYIDTGLVPTPDIGFVFTVAYTGYTSKYGRLFGVQKGGTSTMTARQSASTSGDIYVETVGGVGGVRQTIPFDTNVHTYRFNYPDNSVSIDDSKWTYTSLSSSYAGSVWLLGNNDASGHAAAEVYGFKCYSRADSYVLNDFKPVRIGTDATSWEGAMMDTLTRRIYRNAGTGAFAFGNDLKYPIPAS